MDDNAVQIERRRIARLLHDTFNQSLFAASTIAGALPSLLEKKPELFSQYLGELEQQLRASAENLRQILDELAEE